MVLARGCRVAAGLAATLALAACGSESEPDAGGAGAVAASTAPAATATTAAPAGDGEVSEGGETLALGERVVAPYVVYGKTAGSQQDTKLGVTVLRVRKGRISDFKDFKLDRKQKSTVPYFVDMKVENLGKLKLQRFLLDPQIEDTDGEAYRPLNLIIISGTFKKCPEPSRSRLRGGESFTLCAPFLLPKGTTFERVRFHGDVTKDPYFWK